MSTYAERFIKSRGETAVIERTPPISTKVSIKRSTNSTMSLGAREAYWEGIIPIEDNLQSGEYITIRGDKHLVQSVNFDKESLEQAFYVVKCNCTIKHQREFETGVDEWNQIIREWRDVNPDFVDIPSYCEAITYRAQQADVGLLDSTKYTFQLPKNLNIQLMDRIVYNGNNYEVNSIDDVGLEGVSRVQAKDDVRP